MHFLLRLWSFTFIFYLASVAAWNMSFQSQGDQGQRILLRGDSCVWLLWDVRISQHLTVLCSDFKNSTFHSGGVTSCWWLRPSAKPNEDTECTGGGGVFVFNFTFETVNGYIKETEGIQLIKPKWQWEGEAVVDGFEEELSMKEESQERRRAMKSPKRGK